jgi:hypothetical protein
MTHCYDEGRLRAYLDNELPPAEHEAVRAHLSGCAGCRDAANTLRVQVGQVERLLAQPVGVPDPQQAWNRLQETLPTSEQHARPHLAAVPPRGDMTPVWRKTVQNKFRSWSAPYRRLAAAVALVAVVAGLLALPPVRAAADQFLNIFRVQQVLFVPISSERIDQLQDLDFDGATLLMGEPEMIDEPAEPYAVDTVAAAEQAVGYTLDQPSAFPPDAELEEIQVMESGTAQFQVNVETARQLLELLEIDDVTLPDELGEQPITVSIPAHAMLRYEGENYALSLHQSPGPEVALPEGVDLAQLGKAALRVLGMDEQQAETLSQDIDWSSTLVFPFPSDLDSIRQVTVGDTQGLLTNGENSEGTRVWQLYWQQGDRLYVLFGEGRLGQDDMVLAAESVR